MNILLNFFPVRSGGGQQVASNFLHVISLEPRQHNWFLYVGKGSELHHYGMDILPDSNILAIKYSYRSRVFAGMELKKFIKEKEIDLIYNYAPSLSIDGQIPQVVRSVYSNLYFPEINFWRDYSFITRLKKKIIDSFRLKGTLRAHGLIFENKSMQDRASKLYCYPLENTLYVEPSVSKFDESKISEKYCILESDPTFKILYLSSWHLNKNIHILPYVARHLKERGVVAKFILSLDEGNYEVRKYILWECERLGVEEYFVCIGKVPAIFVHQVVKICDSMILLSKLECFSSNIIEAYSFRKPLIIADEPWAKSECLDAALYVNRENPEEIAKCVMLLMRDRKRYEELIKEGDRRLVSFNSPLEKVEKQILFLEYIYRKFSK